MSGQGPAPRLTIRGAKKRFGGVRALDGVDLTVAPGEIHALLGENGAGKSTLMRLLAGVIAPDAGELALDGAAYAPRAPRDARERGIAMIHQELNLCPELTVLDNVTLGAESTRFGVLDRKASAARLAEVLEALGVTTFGPRTLVRDLGPGDRQLVEIARALMFDASLIVFDEPTSSLSRPDVARLFDVARGLRDRGVSIVWISHFLDEVEALCDRFTVLRDGVTVGDGDVAGTPKEAMVARMVGRPLEDIYPDGQRDAGDVCLRVEGLKGRRAPESASFELRRGEILGVFGLVGAGRTEMLRVLFGLDARVEGTIEHKGERILKPTPRAWVQRGVGLLSEDRAHEGLAVDLSLAENAVLSSLESLAGRGGSLSPAAKTRAFDPWRTELGIRCDGPDQSASELSGGNQQKVAIARLLQSGADVLLLDEPTRGIDVGAKVEVYRLLDALARKGHAILVVSSHIPELLGIADRIACMNRGVLTPARPRSECTEPSVLQDALATR